APVALEDRLALSHVAPPVVHPTALNRPHGARAQSGVASVPGAPAAGTPQPGAFALDIHDTLAAGMPVYEQFTTKYADGTSEIEDELTVPDLAHQTTTLSAYISLRGATGVETFVDHKTTASDGTVTRNYVTTHADGSIDT